MTGQEAPVDTAGVTRFLLVCSMSRATATVRLSSEPLMLGLGNRPGITVETFVPGTGATLQVDGSCCIVFHYDDEPAVRAIRDCVAGERPALVTCLCSDIYSYGSYIELHRLVDIFIAPTEHHRRVLASQLYKPVRTMLEGIDPIASGDVTPGACDGVPVFPAKTGRRAVWFGYAESFSKGMSSLIPVIEASLSVGSVERFGIIVNEDRFSHRFADTARIDILPYDNATFCAQARGFDYAILSHFALDLGVNSYIKSPNKAITALFAGMIPICSDTPNYRDLLTRYGLDRFLFASPAELGAILSRLDPVADCQAVRASGIVAGLRAERSPTVLAGEFLRVIDGGGASEHDRRYAALQPQPLAAALPVVSLRGHLQDLAPSLLRALKWRVARAAG